MDTTFTGIRNLSYLKIHHANQKTKIPSEPMERYVLNMELTNDATGNDLAEFQTLLKKTGLRTQKHPLNPNFLNIEMFTNSGYSDTGRVIFLNRVGIKITDNMLPMMSFVGKLLKRISNMREQDFQFDRLYWTSNNVSKNTLMGEDILEFVPNGLSIKEQVEIIRGLHSPTAVANGCKKMSKIFTDEMVDYFS